MRLNDTLALFVRCFGIIVILSNEIGGKALLVVGVSLPIRHGRIDPGHQLVPVGIHLFDRALSGFIIPEKQFIVQLIVICRLFEGYPVIRMVRKGHPKTICLNFIIPFSINTWWLIGNIRQQPTLWVSSFNVGIYPVDKIMVIRISGYRPF